MSEQPLTRSQLARVLGIHPRTVDRRRRDGMPCRLVGKRSPRFYLSEIGPWLDAHFPAESGFRGGHFDEEVLHSAAPFDRTATTEGSQDG